MPTKRRRHALTETPAVETALNELRRELGVQRVNLPELVVLGAREKVARIRGERDGAAALRARLAERIRRRALPVDPAAADEVRRSGWSRQ